MIKCVRCHDLLHKYQSPTRDHICNDCHEAIKAFMDVGVDSEWRERVDRLLQAWKSHSMMRGAGFICKAEDIKG